MSNTNPINDKKNALLAYKEKILQDIQYYDKRIDDFRADQKNNCFYDDADSSDSEDYFPNATDVGPEVSQLKTQQAMYKTCLHATQELTSLTVLQSEVNVLVQDPQLNGEAPITEPGTWKEVTAECRIDLVPFTITFYMHTPTRKFGPTLYRGVQISLIKSAHETELSNSVLHTLKTPSDAIEVVRSYAVAHRSRRTTLARLANKYASSLFMEPHPEGGFVLKCGNLLEILWRLENKWSQVAPFHHRMKFDLEYMDESYIKIITQAHKQLLDPSLQTDERTLLLSKIIATVLEARGPVDSESDLESRQTGIQTETETNEPKDKDREVMAPPKSLPKKSKKIAAKDKNDDKELGKEQQNMKGITKDKNVKEMVKDKIVDKETDKDKNIDKELGKDKNVNEEIAKDKNINKESAKDKRNNKELGKDKNVNKELGKDNTTNKESAKCNKVNKDTAKDKNVNKQHAKDKNINKDLGKDKTSAQKRSLEGENKDENAKKMKINEGGSKKSLKAKEKSGDIKNVDNKKVKKNNVDDDGIKKKPNENQDESKKTKNNEKAKKTEKNNKQNENKNIDENNKNATNTNSAKKRKNDVLEDIPIANDGKGPKKSKSNEEIKGKNVDNVESNRKKVKNNTNENKNDKRTKSTDAVPKNNKNTNIVNKGKNSNVEEDPETNDKAEKVTSNNEIKKKNNKNRGSDRQTKNDDIPIEIPNDNENEESGKSKNKIAKEKNKNIKENDNIKKIDRKTKMSIANDNKFDQITKKVSVLNKEIEKKHVKNVANNKNSIGNKNDEIVNNNKEENKNIEKKNVANTKTAETKQNVNLKSKSAETLKNKNIGNTKDVHTVTEKNATNYKSKEKIANINKVTEKLVKSKPITKNDKIVTEKPKTITTNKTHTKITLKSVRDIIHKSPKNKNTLKPQNLLKTTKSMSNGSNKMFFGNTEKENGAKISKIPQKRNSLNSESSLKKNMLRVSPRVLPSKFKTISNDLNTKNMMKSTNIPRLMKKPAPKTSQ